VRGLFVGCESETTSEVKPYCNATSWLFRSRRQAHFLRDERRAFF
jgi:hypothetical protein